MLLRFRATARIPQHHSLDFTDHDGPIPTTSPPPFSAPVFVSNSWSILDCHHGRVLVHSCCLVVSSSWTQSPTTGSTSASLRATTPTAQRRRLRPPQLPWWRRVPRGLRDTDRKLLIIPPQLPSTII